MINIIEANVCVKKYFKALSVEYFEFFFNIRGIKLSKFISNAIQIISHELEEITKIIEISKINKNKIKEGWRIIKIKGVTIYILSKYSFIQALDFSKYYKNNF